MADPASAGGQLVLEEVIFHLSTWSGDQKVTAGIWNSSGVEPLTDHGMATCSFFGDTRESDVENAIIHIKAGENKNTVLTCSKEIMETLIRLSVDIIHRY